MRNVFRRPEGCVLVIAISIATLSAIRFSSSLEGTANDKDWGFLPIPDGGNSRIQSINGTVRVGHPTSFPPPPPHHHHQHHQHHESTTQTWQEAKAVAEQQEWLLQRIRNMKKLDRPHGKPERQAIQESSNHRNQVGQPDSFLLKQKRDAIQHDDEGNDDDRPMDSSDVSNLEGQVENHLHPVHARHQLRLSATAQESIARLRQLRGQPIPEPEYTIIPGKEDLARRGRQASKIFYFLHIHKSAGSSMCRTAFRNRMSVNIKENCNVQSDQRCCGGRDKLSAQIGFAQATYYDFVAAEAEMYDAMAPDYYHYVVNLRDSRDRYLSHWNHVRYHGQVNVTDTFQEWWARQPDNFNTRIICGPRCQNVSKFSITPELYNYTLQRLALFEDILFVETLNTSYTNFVRKHNWTTVIDKIVNKKEKRVNATEIALINWDPMMSALDDALYAFAQRKMAGLEPYGQLPSHIQSRVDDYLSNGTSRNCSGPCCGVNCSKYR